MRIIIPIRKKHIIDALRNNDIPVKTKVIEAVQRQIASVAVAWGCAWLQDAKKEDLEDAIEAFRE